MKTTLDIPENLLKELLDAGNFSSKTEAVDTAIEAFLRDRRVESLPGAAGTMDDFITQTDLDEMRRNR